MEFATGPKPSLGGILGNAAYFVKRGAGVGASFPLKTICFKQPKLTFAMKNTPRTRTNPTRRTHMTETAEDLRFEDFATIITRQEAYTTPPTVSRGAATNVITIFTVPPHDMGGAGGGGSQRLADNAKI